MVEPLPDPQLPRQRRHQPSLLPHWAVDYVTALAGHFGGGRDTMHWLLWTLSIITGRQIEHAIGCAKGIRYRRVPTLASVNTTKRLLQVSPAQSASCQFLEE